MVAPCDDSNTEANYFFSDVSKRVVFYQYHSDDYDQLSNLVLHCFCTRMCIVGGLVCLEAGFRRENGYRHCCHQRRIDSRWIMFYRWFFKPHGFCQRHQSRTIDRNFHSHTTRYGCWCNRWLHLCFSAERRCVR